MWSVCQYEDWGVEGGFIVLLVVLVGVFWICVKIEYFGFYDFCFDVFEVLCGVFFVDVCGFGFVCVVEYVFLEGVCGGVGGGQVILVFVEWVFWCLVGCCGEVVE